MIGGWGWPMLGVGGQFVLQKPENCRELRTLKRFQVSRLKTAKSASQCKSVGMRGPITCTSKAPRNLKQSTLIWRYLLDAACPILQAVTHPES